jgi:hypothetical protein
MQGDWRIASSPAFLGYATQLWLHFTDLETPRHSFAGCSVFSGVSIYNRMPATSSGPGGDTPSATMTECLWPTNGYT